MTKVGQFVFAIMFISFLTPMAFSQIFDFGDYSTEFGLFPTTPTKDHALPNCRDVEHIESVPGIAAHGGYCLGPITSTKDYYENKFALTIVEEYIDKDGIIRVVRRNRFLMSIASFYSFCRPRGGLLSNDGLYCEYKTKF
jgi:hypothetical protein